MWQEYALWHVKQALVDLGLRGEDVETDGRYLKRCSKYGVNTAAFSQPFVGNMTHLTILQSFYEGLFVDDFTSGGIDDYATSLHAF